MFLEGKENLVSAGRHGNSDILDSVPLDCLQKGKSFALISLVPQVFKWKDDPQSYILKTNIYNILR